MNEAAELRASAFESARGRKPTPAPERREVPMNEAAARADFATVAELGAQEQARVNALALQMGYEGSLTVGTLEDEIRFYQRRTVEAILETGKRLLLLRELSQIGTEFDKRCELLGFTRSTAYRFMQAASKTAKSAKLAVLSNQVKNGSAFLELVTHDDDELKALDDLDDVDRMSASQLRAKLREARAEKQAVDKVLEVKNQQIDKLQLVQVAPPDEQFQEVLKKATSITNDALGAIRGGVRASLTAMQAKGGGKDNAVLMAGLLGQLQAEINALREEFNLPDTSTAADRQLAAEVAQWAN